MGELYKKYCDWIDWSVYEGLDDDEGDALEEEHFKKYGLNHVLRKDAPPEAVAAWEEDARQSRNAAARGMIID